MLGAIAQPVLRILLVCSLLATGSGQLADPEFVGADGVGGEVFEVLPEAGSFNHYFYPPPRPPRLRLVKKTAHSKSSPLQAVQKVFVAKPPAVSYMSMSTSRSVVVALISQIVGTLFFMVMAKLVLGMKAILATNTATLGLVLWNYLKKKKKLKLKKKFMVHKPVKVKRKKKKPHGHKQWLQLTNKQVKKIIKLLSKKKIKKH